METGGLDRGIEHVGIECLHGPATGGRTKLVMGDAPHELKKGTPATDTFVGCVLDGFTVGGAVDDVADVPVPVGVVRVHQDVLTHQLHIGVDAVGDLQEALAPAVLGRDFVAVL
jgi:hypothetical protein